MNAKRNLIVLGFLTAILVGELGVRAASEYIPTPSSWPTAETALKASQLADLGDQVEVVFLGSSVTEAAVDTEWLSDLTRSVTYNSGLPWSTPASYEPWLREVVFVTNNPRLVIIGIPPWTWSRSDDDPLSVGIERSTNQSLLDSYLGWSQLIKHRGGFADWDRTLGRSRLTRSDSWTELGHRTDYYDLMSTESEAGFPDYRLQLLDREQEAELQSLFELVRQNDAEPIVLIEPARRPGPGKMELVRGIIAELARIAADSEVVFWDTFSSGWPENLFADDAHFNREGTVAYTRHIAGLLDPLVRQAEDRPRWLASTRFLDSRSSMCSPTCAI